MVIMINSMIGGFGWKNLVWLPASTVQLSDTVYNGVTNFNEKVTMKIVDPVNNQNPMSKTTHDASINRKANTITITVLRIITKKPINLDTYLK